MAQAMADPLYFETRRDGDDLTVSLKGDWVFGNVTTLQRQLGAIDPGSAGHVTFRCGGLQDIDVAGAWVLFDASKHYQKAGRDTDFVGFKAAHFKFLEQVTAMDSVPADGTGAAGPGRVSRAVTEVGRAAAGVVEDVGRIAHALLRGITRPSMLATRETLRQLEVIGLRAIPLVATIALLIGVILAYQGATQLRQFGADVFVVDLVAVAIFREMGVVLTAIILAGRSVSAFAAEIGEMKLNEEVDALRVLGVDPAAVLVTPRVLAMVIALPLLTCIADVAGLLGGMLLSVTVLDMAPQIYVQRALGALDLTTLLVGVSKAPVIALAIAAVGTLRGMQVGSSSEELGRMTTRAVVESIFMIVIIDAVFTVVFSLLGI